MTKILMVCAANICRSPMAQLVLQQKLRNAGLAAKIKVESAGTHALVNGKSPDPRVLTVLARRNYKADKKKAKQLAYQDFEAFDLILAMDASNMAALLGLCPPQYHHKLEYLMKFAPTLGCFEIPDPYFGDLAGFERVLDLCEAAVAGVIRSVA